MEKVTMKQDENNEEIDVIMAPFEYMMDIDGIRPYTQMGYQMFAGDPYFMIISYGTNTFQGKKLFFSLSQEPIKTQSPTFDRREEPLKYENIKVKKDWVDKCYKIALLEKEKKKLEEEVKKDIPKQFLKDFETEMSTCIIPKEEKEDPGLLKKIFSMFFSDNIYF